MKVLIFTDSRGQHVPRGSNHKMFPYMLAEDSRLSVDMYLCPFKWTTTLDFLSAFDENTLTKYDLVILYTGIVDWSPRPLSNALNDVYNSKAEENIANLKLNTDNYNKKIVNNKKEAFDKIFGERNMREHLAQPFDVVYEGEKTINMYSVEMAEKYLIPRFLAIKNLLFINANRFCPGWSGDYWKKRPDNIGITHKYAELFSRVMPKTKIVDLLEWSEEEVKLYTCDNLHLSNEGNNYIYNEIMRNIGCNFGRTILRQSSEDSRPTLKSPTLTAQQLKQVLSQEELIQCKRTTLIIGVRFCNNVDVRVDNFNFLISWLDKYYADVFDYLVVEQDATPRLHKVSSGLPSYIRYEFITNPKDYNRGWGYNVAAKHFCKNSDVLVFMDTDVLTGSGFVESILACHGAYHAISPYRNIYYSEPQEVLRIRETYNYDSLGRSDGVKNPVTFTGGVVIVKKSSFLSINGFEQYIGYGCEDRALDVTLINKYGFDKLFMVDEVYVHLFHESDRSARSNFDLIYDHLKVNYRCSYDPTIGPYDNIHKNCDHASRWVTDQLTESRKASFGDVDLYKQNADLLSPNGQIMTALVKQNNIGLLPRIHSALKIKDIKNAWDICQSGILRYRDSPVLLAIFKAKLAEIERQKDSKDHWVLNDTFDFNNTLVILGNGPSLKDIMSNPDHLDVLRKCHTFGLNAAYRAYERFGFYPTYFGSFDYEVNESHRVAYEDLVLNCDKIKKYYFAKNKIFSDNVREHPRFQKMNFIPAPMGVSKQAHMSTIFDEFNDIGSSGTNAVQVGYVLGYRKFILLGCDCKYVEILDGIEVKNEVRYRLTKDLDKNPNYWFDDYQKAGDKFNKPNTDSIQYVAWQKLRELQDKDNFVVSNGSYPSALRLFDKVPFGIYTRHYENVFLVMSCVNNSERINAIKRQYENALSQNDLLLFVVGGVDHDGIDDESVLSLNCGDLYEHLPKKVYCAIRFCVRNLSFRRIVKVDDDIFINFSNFYSVVDPSFECSYYGRKNPPVAGTILNQKYHFGRISESHKYHNKEFPLPKNIQWNSGGMYILDHKSANAVCNYGDIEWIDSHLYEDVMIYTILDANGISPAHHENSEKSSLTWMAPTLDGILTPDLSEIAADFALNNLVSIHCGATKSRNLANGEIWDVFYKLNGYISGSSSDVVVNNHEEDGFDDLSHNNKVIEAYSFNRPLSFYLNKIVRFGGDLFLIKSEAGQIVRKYYARDVWLELVERFSGNITVYIPDFNVAFLPGATQASELPSYLDLQPGLTFLVRAKNEVDNIRFLLTSLRPILNDRSLNCELVFVDNASTDGTYDRVIEITRSSGIQNVSLCRYDIEISRSGDEHTKLRQSGQMHRSLDTYYNWCLDQASKYNVIKWDADFLAVPDNLKLMIAQYNLAHTDAPLAIWCSGKTLFKHGEEFYVNENTMYNEFRVFSKAKGYQWEYAPRWEICSQDYMSKAKKYAFAPCVFFELKDLGKNEFEFRSQGGAITSDVRDSRDDVIIKSLRDGSHSSIALNQVGFNPLVSCSDKSSLLDGFEATNEELGAMQSYWLNVYSRQQAPLRFAHKDNSIIQGLWVGDQISDFHRLCIESFLRNGHCYVLYTYGPVKNVPEKVVIKDANKIIPESMVYQYDGSYAGFSDLFRNKLLFVNGGWYVDLDIYCLRPFDIESEIMFSLDHYHQDAIKARLGTDSIIYDKYYVATNPCKLPAGHEIARSMFATIFKKIVFERIKSVWLGNQPDAPESWLKGDVAATVIISALEKLQVVGDFETFVGKLSKLPNKCSFYKLLDTYNVALKDVGQKTWGEIGPIMVTREVVSRGLQKYTTKPEMFQGVVKYFEIENFVDSGFDYLTRLKEANPYSLDLFFTMWRRKGLLDKFDTTEDCLLKHIRDLVKDNSDD